jgi:hypothetical protein
MNSSAPDLRIPTTVRIGVIGHHSLQQADQLAESVRAVLGKLDKILAHTPHSYVVLSSLAEGAERLVTNIIHDWQQPPCQIEVLLPFSTEEYIKSFDTQQSQREFQELWDKATAVRILDEKASGLAGKEVISHCGILLAIWNGEEELDPAGISALVNYARNIAGRTVYWINAINGAIERFDNDDGTVESLEHLDQYNAERVDSGRLAAGVENSFTKLEALAYECGIRSGSLEPLQSSVLPHLVRSEILAARSQNWHVAAGLAVYLLAALAVATVTIVTLFLPCHPEWIWLEVAEIGLILAVLWFSWWSESLRKWIDYRFFAERLRATIFLFTAGLECEPPQAPEYLSMSHRPSEWMVTAFASVCNCPLQPLSEEEVESVRKFALKGWVLDQKEFYKRRGHRLRLMHEWLAGVGLLLFALTFLAAICHAMEWLPEHEMYVAAAASILPAAGASVAGFRAFREYLRSSKQYEGMLKYLRRLGNDLDGVTKSEELIRLLKEANHVMMREHQGWRVVVSVHEPREAI